MPPGTRAPRRSTTRKLTGKIAYQTTALWFVIAVFHPFFLGGFSYDARTGFHVALNYPLVVASTLLPIAAWALFLSVKRREEAAGKRIVELQSLAPDSFENWVGARFRELGYSVKVTGRGGDHGIDLTLKKPGESAIVQCKNYRAWSVGEPVLRDLFGAMHDQHADHAYLVTSGRLTDSARAWAQGKPLTIWDGDCLVRMGMSAATVSAPQAAASVTASAGNIGDKMPASPTAGDNSTSADRHSATQEVERRAAACPRCGLVLVVRHNRTTGQPFLACRAYPNCRHTQPLPSKG